MAEPLEPFQDRVSRFLFGHGLIKIIEHFCRSGKAVRGISRKRTFEPHVQSAKVVGGIRSKIPLKRLIVGGSIGAEQNLTIYCTPAHFMGLATRVSRLKWLMACTALV